MDGSCCGGSRPPARSEGSGAPAAACGGWGVTHGAAGGGVRVPAVGCFVARPGSNGRQCTLDVGAGSLGGTKLSPTKLSHFEPPPPPRVPPSWDGGCVGRGWAGGGVAQNKVGLWWPPCVNPGAGPRELCSSTRAADPRRGSRGVSPGIHFRPPYGVVRWVARWAGHPSRTTRVLRSPFGPT